MIREDYATTATQIETAKRHARRRNFKPMTETDRQKVEAAARKRERKGRSAD